MCIYYGQDHTKKLESASFQASGYYHETQETIFNNVGQCQYTCYAALNLWAGAARDLKVMTACW